MDTQNEGDLRQSTLYPSISLSFGHAGHSPKKETDPSVKLKNLPGSQLSRGRGGSGRSMPQLSEYGTKCV